MTSSYFLASSRRYLLLGLIFVAGIVSIIATSGESRLTTNVACTGPSQHVRTGSAVKLDARCSDFTDAASDNALLTYFWRLTDKPAGSSKALTSFLPIMFFVPDVDGQYVFELMAGEDSTMTRVFAYSGNAPPMVEAGAYQEVAIGDTVQLNASATDADDDSVTYSWNFRPGAEAETLSDASAASPTFIASKDSDYLVDLVVDDGAAQSLGDSVLIRSKGFPASLPVAVAGADQFAYTGSQVFLDALQSYSAYNRDLSYRWRMLSRPAESSTFLSGALGAQPSFIADLAGYYIIRLTVDEVVNESSRVIDGVFEDRLVVYASNNQLPIADGGVDQSVNTGVTVTLDGINSSDPELATLTYDWSLIKQPASSNATISSFDSQVTQIIPDVDGIYLVRLVVNDGTDDSYPDIVRVSASSLSGSTPLTVITSLPFTPAIAEVGTWIQIDNDGSDSLGIITAADINPANFDTALIATTDDAVDADFTNAPGWMIISPPSLTIDDTTTPSFILQRNSDGVYYKIILDFTVLGNLTVRIDSPLFAWRCGINPADCP